MRALANPQDGAGKRNGVLEQRSIGVSNPSVHHSSTPTEEANKRNEAYDFFLQPPVGSNAEHQDRE